MLHAAPSTGFEQYPRVHGRRRARIRLPAIHHPSQQQGSICQSVESFRYGFDEPAFSSLAFVGFADLDKLPALGETESGSAGTQPDKGSPSQDGRMFSPGLERNAPSLFLPAQHSLALPCLKKSTPITPLVIHPFTALMKILATKFAPRSGLRRSLAGLLRFRKLL